MNDERFVIRFDWPDISEPLFAGWITDEQLGFAPTVETAARFTREVAERTLENNYGPNVRACGSVVEL